MISADPASPHVGTQEVSSHACEPSAKIAAEYHTTAVLSGQLPASSSSRLKLLLAPASDLIPKAERDIARNDLTLSEYHDFCLNLLTCTMSTLWSATLLRTTTHDTVTLLLHERMLPTAWDCVV